MRYTIAVTYIITTTGSMTVEAANPEQAQEQVETALEAAWHHDPHDWEAGVALLDDVRAFCLHIGIKGSHYQHSHVTFVFERPHKYLCNKT